MRGGGRLGGGERGGAGWRLSSSDNSGAPRTPLDRRRGSTSSAVAVDAVVERVVAIVGIVVG